MDLESTPSTPNIISTSIQDTIIPNSSQTIPPNTNTDSVYKPKIPPIILNSADWQKNAQNILKTVNLTTSDFQTKIAANGTVWLLLDTLQKFWNIESALRDEKISFETFTLPEDRALKVVIRGIPTEISEKEVISRNSNFSGSNPKSSNVSMLVQD